MHLSNRRPQNSRSKSSAISGPTLATFSAYVYCNSPKVLLCDVTADVISAKFLLDTGSPNRLIDKHFARISGEVTLAETSV